MIAQLTGQLIRLDGQAIILDVGGVGYLVSVSRRTLEKAGQPGDQLTLLTSLQVREDSMTLFGFAEAAEQEAFHLVQTVQGVGAKAALALLSVLGPQDLYQAILAGDKAMVARAEGVGPKLAQRIVNELAEKTGRLPVNGPDAAVDGGAQNAVLANSPSEINDALSALVNLGYGRSEAFAALVRVREASKDSPADLSDMIRLALADLGRGRS